MKYELVVDDITYSVTISPYGDCRNFSYLIECDRDSYLTAEQYSENGKWYQTGGHAFTAPLLNGFYKIIEEADEAELALSFKTTEQVSDAIMDIQYNEAIKNAFRYTFGMQVAI